MTEDPDIVDAMRVTTYQDAQPISLFGNDRLMDLPFCEWTILIQNPKSHIITFGFTPYSNEKTSTIAAFNQMYVTRFSISTRVSFRWDLVSNLVMFECYSAKLNLLGRETETVNSLGQTRPFCIVPDSVMISLLPSERSHDSECHAKWVAQHCDPRRC